MTLRAAGRWYGARPMGMGARAVLVALGLALSAGCVSPPEAERDGGARCATDEDCNDGPLCGDVRRCVLGYCSDDRVFRACESYPDASVAVGECLTWISCNTTSCGRLVPCVNGRCDSTQPFTLPCDGGTRD